MSSEVAGVAAVMMTVIPSLSRSMGASRERFVDRTYEKGKKLQLQRL